MKAKKTDKTFDCVAFKRKVQAEIYREIRSLTPQQQIEYFNRQAREGPLAEWWRKLRST